MESTNLNNNHLRQIWNERADQHFAGKMCQTVDQFSKLYNEIWWRYIEPHLAAITPMFSFPPDRDLKAALEHEHIFHDMLEISQTYAEQPGIVHMSSRLIAVARKPELYGTVH